MLSRRSSPCVDKHSGARRAARHVQGHSKYGQQVPSRPTAPCLQISFSLQENDTWPACGGLEQESLPLVVEINDTLRVSSNRIYGGKEGKNPHGELM